MKPRILNICFAVLLIAAGYVWGNRSVVHARPITNAPKAWGHLVGGDVQGLIFEDSSGSIRIVNPNGGEIVYQMNRQ